MTYHVPTSVNVTAPNPIPDDALVSAVASRREWFGGIGRSTEHRWGEQFEDFPAPIYINGKKYYRAGDIRAFLTARAAESTAHEGVNGGPSKAGRPEA